MLDRIHRQGRVPDGRAGRARLPDFRFRVGTGWPRVRSRSDRKHPALVRAAVLRQALFVAGAGGLVGLAVALATARLIRGLLFQVSPTDPLALAAISAVLLIASGFAAYFPARRATRIDPAQALRSD